MPTLIQQLAQAQTQAGLRPTPKRVVVYSPGRPMPGRAAQAPPQSPGIAPRPLGTRPPRAGSGANAFAKMSQEYAATPEAQEQAQQQAEAAQPDTPWWQDALGMAITPLGVLGTPRRLIQYGIEEFAERTGIGEKVPGWAKPVLLANPLTTALGVASLVDTERTEADKRSFYEKVLDPKSDYGFGQLISNDLPGPLENIGGLYGDIALDPLTAVTAGGGKVIQTGAKAGKEVVLHGGRAERLAELSRLAVEKPHLIEQLTPDILEAGRRGLNTATPELREALGLTAPKMRFAGQAIPGTERIAAPISRATGAARQALQRVPGVKAISRGPKGMEAAVATLTRGTGEMSVPAALTQVKLTNLARIAAGETTTRGNQMLRSLIRKDFKGQSKAQIEQLVREAEQAGTSNSINDFFANIAKVYKETSGVDIEPYLRDPESYVPHMLDPGFRRMLRERTKAGDPVANDFMTKAGFFQDDLLEGSGYIEKARKLQPDIDPATLVKRETEIPIGGTTIKLKTGTIDELNDQLRKVFPGFKGKFYETDPARIGEAYITSLSKAAGSRSALSAVAETGNELVERIGGQGGRGQALGQALEQSNAARNAQQPITDVIRQGYQPGVTELAPPLPPPPIPEEVAGLKVGDFFGEEVNRKATEAQQQFFRNEGREFAKAGARDVRETQGRIAKDLYNMRRNYAEGLTTNVKTAKEGIKPLDQHIDKLEKRLAEMGAHRAETHEELTAFLIGIRKNIDDIERELTNKGRYWKGRMTKARKEAQAELEARWRRLRGIEAAAKNRAQKAPKELSDELTRRIDMANRPITKIQQEIDEVTASVPGRPSDERLASAEETLQKIGREVVDPMQAKKDEYRDLLSLPKRTKRQNEKLAKLRTELSLNQGRGSTLARNEFDADTERLIQIGEELPNAADDATRAALRKERDALQRRFRQGGKHSAEKRARETMAEYKKWEEDVQRMTLGQQRRLSAAKAQRDLAVDNATVQMDVENRLKMLTAAHEGAAKRADVMEQRAAAPVDWERDVQMVAPVRQAQQEQMGPLQQQLEVAQDLHEEVLDHTRTQLRETDAAMMETREEVLRDYQQRQPLIDKRDESQALLDQLKPTNQQLRSKGKQGVQWKEGELIPVLDEIAAVARQNPNLTDDMMVATEAVLQGQRRDLERVMKNDVTVKQVQALVDKSFKEGKDGLFPVMLTVLNDNWKMLHDGVLQQGDIIVDRKLYESFQNLYELSKEPKWGGRVFNALTNLFKTYATLTPGFHVRNALSGLFMNTADGVAFKAQLDGVKYWSQYMKHGEEVLKTWPPDVREAFRAAAGSGAGGQFTEAGVAASSSNRFYNALSNNRFTRSGILGKRGGERVEGALRMGMGLDTIRKGGTMEDALTRITRVHFDYTQVSRLDEQMKRIVPFWTFMSRNLPLQITEMWTKPRTYAIYESALRNFGQEPEEFTPQYWLDAGARNTGINVPTVPGLQEGGSLYFAPDLGYTRLKSDVANIGKALQGDIGGLVSAGNPLLTAPTEFFTGKDFYTGRTYTETDNVYADPITTFLAGLVGQKNEAGQTSQKFQNLLRSVNPLMDRSIRLAPNVAGGTERDKSRILESYARLFGAPGRVLTPQAQDSEYWRRYYDVIDEAERQRKMLELQARQAG